MRAAVIYESKTGNTARAAQAIVEALEAHGVTASASPTTQVDLQAVSDADLLIIGTWTHGLFLFGMGPAGEMNFLKMPVIDGKKTAIFCTYAHDPGKTLSKFDKIITKRGGDVIGGYAIKRTELREGAEELVGRLMGAMESS